MIIPIISIPKSGTHFIKEIIQELCNITNKSFTYKFSSTSNEATIPKEKANLTKDFNTFRENTADMSCYLGHWACQKPVYDLFKPYPSIFIYRHPFAVATSFIESGLRGLSIDVVVVELKKMSSKEEMYRAFLKGLPKIKHPWARGLKNIYEDRYEWTKKEEVFSMKYRDLLPRAPVTQFADYLGVDAKLLKKAVELARKKGESKTYRKGIVDNWKQEMPESVMDEYNDALSSVIQKFGY